MERSTEVLPDHAYDGGYDVFAEYGKGRTSGTAGSKPSYAEQQEGTGGRWPAGDMCTPSKDETFEGSQSDYNRTTGYEGEDGGGGYGGKTEEFASRPAWQGHGRNENQEEGGYRKPSSYEGSGYGRNENQEEEGGYRKPSSYEGSGYGRNENQEEGGYRKPSSYEGSGYGRSESDYDSGYGESKPAWQEETDYGGYGGRTQPNRQGYENSEEGNRRPSRRQGESEEYNSGFRQESRFQGEDEGRKQSEYYGEGDDGYQKPTEYQRPAYGRSNDEDKLSSEAGGLSLGASYGGGEQLSGRDGGDEEEPDRHHGRHHRKYDDY